MQTVHISFPDDATPREIATMLRSIPIRMMESLEFSMDPDDALDVQNCLLQDGEDGLLS